MINKDFFKEAIELANEKAIDVEDVYEIYKRALASAYKKVYNSQSCRVEINPARNEILLYGLHVVVESYSEVLPEGSYDEMLLEDAKKIKASYKVGDIVEQNINIKNLGSSGARAAKSVTTQDIKNKEREKAFDYFKENENEMVSATVGNIGEKYVTLKLAYNVISSVPKSEIEKRTVVEGATVNVYVKKVESTNKGPKVLVSMNDIELVKRVMEKNIPEIAEGYIEIKGIARDAGDRSKVAVALTEKALAKNSEVESANDPYGVEKKIDAIGTCVGEKGLRSMAIVNDLHGEKIDLYEWSEDPETLIKNSLKPAEVKQVLAFDVKTKTSTVIVPDDQLSLAIGKHGQNVTLAVYSSGWKIDIKSVSQAFDENLIIITK